MFLAACSLHRWYLIELREVKVKPRFENVLGSRATSCSRQECFSYFFSWFAFLGKLQNTGPLLKRVSLEWLGGSPVALTDEPPSRRAAKLYTFLVL